jgi:hypothetical protein
MFTVKVEYMSLSFFQVMLEFKLSTSDFDGSNWIGIKTHLHSNI